MPNIKSNPKQVYKNINELGKIEEIRIMLLVYSLEHMNKKITANDIFKELKGKLTPDEIKYNLRHLIHEKFLIEEDT